MLDSMKPIVQISLDLTTASEALETAEMAMRAGVDWLEAGTPLIIAEGMHGVRAREPCASVFRKRPSWPTSRPWTAAISKQK